MQRFDTHEICTNKRPQRWRLFVACAVAVEGAFGIGCEAPEPEETEEAVSQPLSVAEQDQKLNEKYRAIGFSHGPLGFCNGPTFGPSQRVRRMACAKGYIYINVRSMSAPVMVHNAIAQGWIGHGGETSSLGLPVSNEFAEWGSKLSAKTPRRQLFENGSMYWSQRTGAAPMLQNKANSRWMELRGSSGPLGFPVAGGLSDQVDFERGRISWERVNANVRFYIQNMGLFPAPLYKGPNRENGIKGLVKVLRDQQPDVVGLSEMWVDSEQSNVAAVLHDIYPHKILQPRTEGVGLSSGLLLLSKHPIIEEDWTEYRTCFGEDCHSDKGVVFARIALPGNVSVDVYLTHTQNPDPAVEVVAQAAFSGRDALARQARIIANFVQATRDPGNPAIVMGDLNYNGKSTIEHQFLLEYLGYPEDVWTTSGNGGPGITFDKVRNFDKAGPPISSPERHKEGSRLDFFLYYKGKNVRANFENTEVKSFPDAHGRDLSDHYGLMTTLRWFDRFQVQYTGPIPSVTATLDRFHCFNETGGGLGDVSREIEADEMVFKIEGTGASGSPVYAVPNWTREESVQRTDRKPVWSRPTISIFDPGNQVNLAIRAKEIDGPLQADRTFPPARITVNADMLLDALIRPQPMGALLRYDGGEYAVTVNVSAHAPREDQVAEIVPSIGHWGSWNGHAMCANGTWATGYRMTVEAQQGDTDDSGLNAVELLCAKDNQISKRPTVSHPGSFGVQHGWAICPNADADDFLVGARMRIEPSLGGGRDDTAANDVEFECASGQTLQAPGGSPWGDWQPWVRCPARSAVCGISTRNEEYQGPGDGDDDTAMNGMKLFCCRPGEPGLRGL